MVGVVFVDVFDSEVIYNEGECDGAGDISSQTGRVGYFEISVWGEVFLEGCVFELAGLW